MPRPARNRPRKPPPPLPQDVATQAEMKGLSPLAYLLRVLNDPKASKARRDRAAIVAARYIHRRPADDSVGKKDLLAAAALEAGLGTPWADDLDADWQQ